MNPNTDPVYAGFTHLHLDSERIELGHGVVVSRTFAHLMAPFLMAFAPAEPGKPHPAPLSAVKGGFGFDIHAQLYIPAEFSLPNWFDRLNTVWWIAALLRLRVSPIVTVPAIADRPFADIPGNWREAEIWPLEATPHRLVPLRTGGTAAGDADVEWVREHWIQGGVLMNQSVDFNPDPARVLTRYAV